MDAIKYIEFEVKGERYHQWTEETVVKFGWVLKGYFPSGASADLSDEKADYQTKDDCISAALKALLAYKLQEDVVDSMCPGFEIVETRSKVTVYR